MRTLLLAALFFIPYSVESQSPPERQPGSSLSTGTTTEMSAEDIFSRFAGRVLFLTCDASADDLKQASGVLISADGFIATNAHVVDGCPSMTVTQISGTSRRSYEPVLKYYDRMSDTAILKIEGKGFGSFGLITRTARVGERVYAIGNPRGLEQSISEGIVSGLRDEDGTLWIQHSAPIFPGSSGGALISSRGELLGINSWFVKESQGLNFAVPAATLAIAYSRARVLQGFLQFPGAPRNPAALPPTTSRASPGTTQPPVAGAQPNPGDRSGSLPRPIMPPPPEIPMPPTISRGSPGTTQPPVVATQPNPGDRSESLPGSIMPPPPEIPTPHLGSAQNDPLIHQAIDATVEFTQILRSYTCTAVVSRYESTTRPPAWHSVDTVSADLGYENGRENYRNIRINGKPTNTPLEKTGAWSTGEFGTLLVNVFSPSTAAEFHFRRDGWTSGIDAKVYDFSVKRENSIWDLRFDSQVYAPAYEGSAWIDPKTGRVLRLEIEARNLPVDLPTDHVESATDYQYVRLGDAQELLPVHAEFLTCRRGTDNCSRNTIDFRGYRKFASEPSASAAPRNPYPYPANPLGVPKPAQKPSPVPKPTPSPEEQAQILDEARDYALNYSKNLPDYVCTLVVHRYTAPVPGGRRGDDASWQPQDTLTLKVSFFEQKEHYKLIWINNMPTQMDYNEVGGSRSTSDSASLLRQVFEPATDAQFEWDHWGLLRGHPTYVFAYHVAQQRSKWHVSAGKKDAITAYKGLIYVDQETKQVLRISLDAVDLPPRFPVRQASDLLDYDYQDAGGQRFLLPYKSKVLINGTEMLTRNDNEYYLYHMYLAESASQFDVTDTLAPASGDKVNETQGVIRLDVTVSDRSGQRVPNLPQSAFTIQENGAPQAIKFFKFGGACVGGDHPR
jgi:Trypsin-like peptidase domain